MSLQSSHRCCRNRRSFLISQRPFTCWLLHFLVLQWMMRSIQYRDAEKLVHTWNFEIELVCLHFSRKGNYFMPHQSSAQTHRLMVTVAEQTSIPAPLLQPCVCPLIPVRTCSQFTHQLMTKCDHLVERICMSGNRFFPYLCCCSVWRLSAAVERHTSNFIVLVWVCQHIKKQWSGRRLIRLVQEC